MDSTPIRYHCHNTKKNKIKMKGLYTQYLDIVELDFFKLFFLKIQMVKSKKNTSFGYLNSKNFLVS